MTRDELVKKVYNALPPSCRTLQANENAFIFVDSLVAVGLLKLDEPKSAKQKFINALDGKVIGHQARGVLSQYVIGPSDASILHEILESYGLKIVEK